MRNFINYKSLLLVTTVLTIGCTNSDDVMTEMLPPADLKWFAVVNASQDSVTLDNADIDSKTRALFIGGNDDRFLTAWDKYDVVQVYKENTKVGELSPIEENWGYPHATLGGTLTGPFNQSDELTLYLPQRNLDYTNQNGDLNRMSRYYGYQYNATTVATAQDQILTLNDVDMHHYQGYWRMRLTDETGKRLHMEQLQISATNNSIVLTKNSGEDPVCGTLIVNFVEQDKEYPAEPFVAIYDYSNASNTYKFRAVVGDDVYVGPSDRALTYNISEGKLANIVRTMKKTTPVSSVISVEAVADQVYTGSAITPALTVTVTEGETPTTLTAGTDYSVEYASNTNVGQATFSITGLAEAGAIAQTKYIGTAAEDSYTFQIVKATPTIEIANTEMYFIHDETEPQTRVATHVWIDNSAYGIANCDILQEPYGCQVTYSSSNENVATVDAVTGVVTAKGPGTCTITATVVSNETTNWNTNTVPATYSVKVDGKVNTKNQMNEWEEGGSTTKTVYL